MRQFLVIFVVLLVCIACAPVSEMSLRQQKSEKQRSFNVEQSYQEVFQSILDKSRACFLATPSDVQFTVVGTRVNRSKTGEIVIAEVYGLNGREVLMLIDVLAINDNETQIKTYHVSRNAEPYVSNIRNWLDDENSGCTAT
ncbi:MAG: hypothetical protein OEX19_07530 [Gammaproteobacteria bacterium]|nr:hypothetical protein [Gammaproteobacteria bacterium]